MTERIPRPGPGEHDAYYAGYIAEAPDGDILTQLERQGEETFALLSALPEERGGYRYAPEKWTIKDLANHLADSERIFAYRALRFARGDATALPGFDEKVYARAAQATRRPLVELASELHAVRAASLALFRGFEPDALTRTGTASGSPISVRSLVWIIAGHERHHVRVLHERYLTG